MILDGYFTANEISTAVKCGATTQKLAFNKLRLKFPTQAALDAWLAGHKTPNEHLTLTLRPKQASWRVALRD